MSYRVNFKGTGFTAPSAANPNGIKVIASGQITVPGDRPARNFDIPFDVIKQCKAVFIQDCQIQRYAGDKPGEERFPTVWLDK